MGEVQRYHVVTVGWSAVGHESSHGPWVSYDDHAKEIDSRRDENERLADEAYNARQSAKGENALRLLEAETSIDDLVDKAHANALDKGFWADVDTNDPRHVLALLMLITTEVAEAAEAVRKSDPDNFAEELADICIRVFDVAGGMGVDLSEEIVTKMRTNKARPRKHGKAC
jgi:NTP pyrophosphatase (non-canonical NTP hydrolase)